MIPCEINGQARVLSRPLSMFVLIVLLITQPARAETEQYSNSHSQPQSSYLIGSGDALEISVWKEAELSKQLVVPPDGVISFPLAGTIQVEGKTIEQITDAITQGLGKVIADPVVNVWLLGFDSQQIYVLGKVHKPGVFKYAGSIDVMQALSIAGGLATFADQDSIKILRRKQGQLVTFPFDYSELEQGKNLQQNIILRRGDVVVVP